MPLHPDGIRRLSLRLGSFHLISRFDLSCVSNVSLTGTMRFPARGQQSTGGYRPQPTFRDVSIHTVYELLLPVTTHTKALPPCRSKLSWGGVIWRLRKNTPVSRGEQRLMRCVVSITGRNFSNVVQSTNSSSEEFLLS